MNKCDGQETESCACTRCDLDRRNNVWIEGGDPNTGVGGCCMLDNLTDAQIIYVLERDDKARCDLLRVTSDPHLRELANTIPRLPTGEQMDEDQKLVNQNSASIPFYSIFRGQIPFNG